jgi:uncharacterized membrane protein YkvA (DUF1232 family)
VQVPKPDFYQKMRDELREWLQSKAGKDYRYAEFLLAAPDLVHLLCRLMLDRDVYVKDKAALGAVLAYFLFPLDFLPEALIGPLGYADDVAAAAWVLNNMLTRTDPEVLRRHWAGEEDILDLVQRIVKAADQMVGSGLWAKIKQRFG